MNKKAADDAAYIVEKAFLGLYGAKTIKSISDDPEEVLKYAKIREDIILDLGCLTSLWMVEHRGDESWVDGEVEQKVNDLQEERTEITLRLEENSNLMSKVISERSTIRTSIFNRPGDA